MSFLENVEKLISDARARYNGLDQERKRMQEDKDVLAQSISRTIEEELRVIGEIRALEKVRQDAEKAPPDKVPEKEN